MATDTDVGVAGTTETSDRSLPSLQSRYMLTQVGQQSLAFPSHWVSEIVLIERSQILSLPFYDRALLGLIHHNGSIVPLLAAHSLLLEALGQDKRSRAMKETLTVVRLGPATDGLVGVGIVVNQVIGNLKPEQLAKHRLFQLSDIPSQLWQPRW